METISDVPSLKTIWTAVSGQVHAPPLVGSLLIYSLAFLTCLLLQEVCKRTLPRHLYSYAADFCFTMLVCCFPYGHGCVRTNYGHCGYVVAAVTMVTMSLLAFEGVASPLGVFVRYLKGEESLWGLGVRVVVQLVAAFMSYRLVLLICSLELTWEHQMLLRGSCVSDLNVPAVLGFLIEFSAVIYDTWLCHQQLFTAPLLDHVAKNINGALLVSAGVHLTGMYMHPAMATAMTFNCKGTDTLEHLAVYWGASFLGCFVGVQLNRVLYLPSSGDAEKMNAAAAAGCGQGDGREKRHASNGGLKEPSRERKTTGSRKMTRSNNGKLVKRHRRR